MNYPNITDPRPVVWLKGPNGAELHEWLTSNAKSTVDICFYDPDADPQFQLVNAWAYNKVDSQDIEGTYHHAPGSSGSRPMSFRWSDDPEQHYAFLFDDRDEATTFKLTFA